MLTRWSHTGVARVLLGIGCICLFALACGRSEATSLELRIVVREEAECVDCVRVEVERGSKAQVERDPDYVIPSSDMFGILPVPPPPRKTGSASWTALLYTTEDGERRLRKFAKDEALNEWVLVLRAGEVLARLPGHTLSTRMLLGRFEDEEAVRAFASALGVRLLDGIGGGTESAQTLQTELLHHIEETINYADEVIREADDLLEPPPGEE